jgi:hypothetical protein
VWIIERFSIIEDIMKSWLWVVVAGLGFGMMWVAYFHRPRLDSHIPWARGLIAVGPTPDKGALAGRQAISAHAKFLETEGPTEAIIQALGQAAPTSKRKVESQIRPKLIELPLEQLGIDAGSLASGRLPVANAGEVIAGPDVSTSTDLRVGDRSLVIVGQLKPDFLLFSRSYLVPNAAQGWELLPDSDSTVSPVTIIQLPPDDEKSHSAGELEKDFPADKYALVQAEERLPDRTFYLYLAGLALLLLGGSGALIGLYGWLGSKISVRWLAAPLLEVRNRPRLIWGVHLVYFGLVIVTAIWIHERPNFQSLLLSLINQALTSKQGALAPVAAAYQSGSVVRAAVATFVVNFFAGTLLMITLPALIVPGSGTLIPFCRSSLWGMLFAPSFASLAFAFLPHSGTMLLEGAGYILATFFGLLAPVHFCERSLKTDPMTRYGRGLILSLQGTFWVAVVLAIAACYEAVEVIAMNH